MSRLLRRISHLFFGHGDWVLDILMMERTEYECLTCGKQWVGAGWREKFMGQEDVYPDALDRWDGING